MRAAHEANDGTLTMTLDTCERRGLALTIYRSSLSHFDGYWRYAAYTHPEAGRPFGVRDKRVTAYSHARYSKSGRPSIRGEREALEFLAAAVSS